MTQSLAGGHLLRDVDQLRDGDGRPVFARLEVVGGLDPQPAPVFAEVAQPDRLDACSRPAREPAHPVVDRPDVVVGMDEFERRLSDHLLRRPTEHQGGRLVDPEDARHLALRDHAEAGSRSRHRSAWSDPTSPHQNSLAGRRTGGSPRASRGCPGIAPDTAWRDRSRAGSWQLPGPGREPRRTRRSPHADRRGSPGPARTSSRPGAPDRARSRTATRQAHHSG